MPSEHVMWIKIRKPFQLIVFSHRPSIWLVWNMFKRLFVDCNTFSTIARRVSRSCWDTAVCIRNHHESTNLEFFFPAMRPFTSSKYTFFLRPFRQNEDVASQRRAKWGCWKVQDFCYIVTCRNIYAVPCWYVSGSVPQVTNFFPLRTMSVCGFTIEPCVWKGQVRILILDGCCHDMPLNPIEIHANPFE